MATRLLPLLVCLLLAWPGAARGGVSRLGPEFQVNTYTTGLQYAPAVAVTPSGDFVVVWMDAYHDGDNYGVIGRRYARSGSAQGPEFLVNSYTTDFQGYAAVAADAVGRFVVVWYGGQPDSGDASGGIFAQRYDETGAPLGPEGQVNSYTTGLQFAPAVAREPNEEGDFVVVWESDGQDQDLSGIFGRRFDRFGGAMGGEFQVNSYTTGGQDDAAVAVDAAGRFVVAWESLGQDGDSSGVFARAYDASGAALGPEFQVNTYTTSSQFAPGVAMDGAGGFAVVWHSTGQDGAVSGVFGQRYAAGGAAVGGEFQVNTYTTGHQGGAGVAVGSAGELVVVWSSAGSQDGSGLGVFARRYTAGGAADGSEFQVSTYTTSDQYGAAVAADAVGNFVVAWDSNGQDGDSTGIFGERLVTEQLLLGKKLIVKDPTGAEPNRTVIGLGTESPTDIDTSLASSSETAGGTLRVVVNGTTPSDETYVLAASGWKVRGTTFRYRGPTAGEPVRKVLLKRTPSGKALLKAIVKGSVGTESLDVTPPNEGTDGGIVLTINGGSNSGPSRYCATFGGAAGGTEIQDTAQLFKVIKATAQPGCAGGP